MKTAEEYHKSKGYGKNELLGFSDIISLMNEYAIYKSKIHVTEALIQASENAEIDWDNYEGKQTPFIDKQSILNAYPLDQIK